MRTWLLIVLPLLVLGGLVGWRFTAKGEQQAQSPKAGTGRPKSSTPAVKLAVAESKSILNTVEGVGTVEAPYVVHLAPRVSGRIEQLVVREGDAVGAGQVLVRIDASELQAQVLQQQANVSEAQSRLAQARLGEGVSIAGVRGQLDQQEASLDSAQADFEQVQRTQEAEVAAAQADVTDADARITAAEAAVKNAEAELKREGASLRNAQTKLARVEELLAKGYVSQANVDDARTNVDVHAGNVSVASGRLESARSAVESAKAQRARAVQSLEIAKRKGIADVAAAAARLKQARAALSIAQANQAQNPAYRENLAALESSLAAARAQLEQARSRLADTSLSSPIKGVVTARNMDAGTLATPGQPILTVQHLDWVYVHASLPIDQSALVRKGQRARVRFDSLQGREFWGEVALVNPAADPESRQFRVSVRLENPAYVLKPGMYGRVAFVSQEIRAGVAIPREAVRETREGKRVIVVDADNIAHERVVETGAADATSVQIVSGVGAGERVVVLSYQPVREGQKVVTGAGAGERPRGAGEKAGAPR